MPKVLSRLLPGLLAAAALAPRANATSHVSFPTGSLIIPTQANFQTSCGMVSSYGLVYNIMRANWSLDPTNNISVSGCPAGGCHRITVHWTYNPGKASPNRCVPTDQDVPPKYYGVSTSPAWNDPTWNDGCDARIVNTAGAPVTLVDNSTGDPTKDTAVSTYSTCSATSSSAACSAYIAANGNVDPNAPPLTYGLWGTSVTQTATRQVPFLAWPQYPAQSIGYTVGGTKNVTSVGYLGGAFVISAADAPVALRLISGQIGGVVDENGNSVTLSQYVVKPATTGIYCNIDPTVSPAAFFWDTSGMPAHMTNDGSGDTYANEHHVNIHRAAVPFSAYDSMQINSTPLRIALLQTAGGIYANASGTNKSVVGDMLPKYLKSAGLDYPGAHGCPINSVNASDTSLCPNGARHGQIYDSLDVLDLASSSDPLNHPASALDAYSVAWLPHWDGTTFTAGGLVSIPMILNNPVTLATTKRIIATCNAACIQTAIQNVATWTRSGQVGLLAECASLGVFEGTTGTGYTFNETIATPGNALLTCSSVNPSTGLCDASPGASMVQGLKNDGSATVSRHNCTDPDLAPSSGCIYQGFAGSPFGQIGDFIWQTQSGFVTEYWPNTGATYRPGTSPLAFTIAAVNKAKLDTYADARAQMLADNFTYMTVDNNTAEGRVIYLGGHTYSSNVAGTRVVLNSILALGLLPVTGETGYSGATAYNYYNSNVAALTPTYDRVTTTGAPLAWNTYNPVTGSQWFYPYHTGHLRALNGTTLTSGSTTGGYSGLPAAAGFNVSDAAATLAATSAANRNIFTYLGGVATKNPSLGSGKSAVNGVIQYGWKPVDIHANSVGTTTGSCLDVLSISQVCGKKSDGTSACTPSTLTPTKAVYTGTSYAGMIPGASGACDLQEALGLTITPSDLGSDFGAATTEQAAIKAKLIDPNAVRDAQELLMMMRGFCYSTSTGLDGSGTAPASWPGKCNNPVAWNNPHLGAFVHSQPVVVGPSTLVPDAPSGKVRPTVAYVGGWDGMLHAFYLPSSSDGSDVSGYTGPLQATAAINTNASSVFHTSFGYGGSGFPSSTLPLTELWAFVPPGQLPYVKTNSARVDSTPAVLDVYGDFDGSGARSWHTVLVASAGDANREIFALDVTNPLAPVMLWEINSGADPTLPYAPVVLADDDTGIDVSVDTQAIVWQNACLYGSTGCTPASFNLPPAADAGRSTSGPYNYQHLGASQSINAALMRRHNVPVYTAFIATNQGDGPGLFVFAIDVVTGQKIWEFANPYTPPFGGTIDSSGNWPSGQTDRQAGVGNTAPAGVAVASLGRTGLIDTVYVGDDMGRLWELDAIDGVNKTAFTSGCSGAGKCNYALSDAYGSDAYKAQPISTVPALFYLPSTLSSGNFKSHAGELMLSYGTAGTDTVASIDTGSNISGVVHMVSLSPAGRLAPGSTGGLSLANATTASTAGDAYEVGPFALMGGERLYGAIDPVGQFLFFATTLGSVTNIDQRGTLGGSTYRLDLGASSLTAGASLDPAVYAVITGLGGAGGTPLLLYGGANSSYSGTLPTSGLSSVKIVTVTDQTVGTYVAPLTAQNITDVIATRQALTNVVGKQAGGNGTLRRFGWLWRTLGIEY